MSQDEQRTGQDRKTQSGHAVALAVPVTPAGGKGDVSDVLEHARSGRGGGRRRLGGAVCFVRGDGTEHRAVDSAREGRLFVELPWHGWHAAGVVRGEPMHPEQSGQDQEQEADQESASSGDAWAGRRCRHLVASLGSDTNGPWTGRLAGGGVAGRLGRQP